MKKVAVNGLGRIGRMVLRQSFDHCPENIEIVAANDLAPTDELAYLLRYDSVQGRASFPVGHSDNALTLGDKSVAIFNEQDPANLPWTELGVDIVLECTGRFHRKEDASKHISAGASKVIISSPSENADLTVVLGVNEDWYDPRAHHIISNASCTTNSLAPAVKVLNDTFGVEYLMVTTVHAYTPSQALLDRVERKRRRGRAAALSLIPESTGAATATALVIPDLKGKMDAISVRVPVPDGAITDIVAHLKTDVSVERINEAFKRAAQGSLKDILAYNDDEIVSQDIIGDPHSGIIDAPSTKVVGNRVVKVFVWYDNEYGYAMRCLDLADYIATH